MISAGCQGDLPKIRPSRYEHECSVVVVPWFIHEAVLDCPYPLNPAYPAALMLSSIKYRLKRLREPAKLRAKYTHFRILVIGRANAGKTTLIKRVCNTTEEPCIYNEKNHNLVSYLLGGLLYSYRPSITSSNRLQKYWISYLVFIGSVTDSNAVAGNTWHSSSILLQEQPSLHIPRFSRIRGRRWEGTPGRAVFPRGEGKS